MGKDQIVYVLTNAAMPGYTKIGKTNNLERRMRELYKTSLPLPFECFYAALVDDYSFVEKQLHDAFGDHRTRSNREFFEVSPERVVSALKLAEIEDVTPKQDYVETKEDQAALDRAKKRRGTFNFTMLDIPAGTELTFSRNPEITCKVIDNKKVEFEGKETSLSSSALSVLHRMGYKWKTIAGTDYWQYKGESLRERRHRMEEEA